LPKADGFGAVADGLPGQGPHLAAVGRAVDGPPAARARRSLRDQEIPAQEAPRQIQLHPVAGRVEMSASRVIVQGSDRQIPGGDVIVENVLPREIVGDELARVRVGADRRGLVEGVIPVRLGDETIPLQL